MTDWVRGHSPGVTTAPPPRGPRPRANGTRPSGAGEASFPQGGAPGVSPAGCVRGGAPVGGRSGGRCRPAEARNTFHEDQTYTPEERPEPRKSGPAEWLRGAGEAGGLGWWRREEFARQGSAGGVARVGSGGAGFEVGASRKWSAGPSYTTSTPMGAPRPGWERTRLVLQPSHYRQERGRNGPLVIATCVNGLSVVRDRDGAFQLRPLRGVVE